MGGVQTFLSYANQYTKPFNEVTSVITQIQTAFASAAAPSLRSWMRWRRSPTPPMPSRSPVPRGDVTLAHVDFSYVPARPLLRDICVHAAPGARIALVGPTGCGKTTLINLLLRFYDVDAGQILLDGHDIRTLTRRSLRAAFGMVLQGHLAV